MTIYLVSGRTLITGAGLQSYSDIGFSLVPNWQRYGTTAKYGHPRRCQ